MLCFDHKERKAGTKVSAYVADSTLTLLQKGGVGEVLMVNSQGVYLLAEGRIIFLCDLSMGCVPSGIAISDFSETVSALSIKPGDHFSFEGLILVFDSLSLFLDPIDLKRPEINGERPKLELVCKAATDLAAMQKTKGISMLVLPLVFGEDREDLFALSPYHRAAYFWLSKLLTALVDDLPGEVREPVNHLLGLGIGLTPSADDVILGMLYAFRMIKCKLLSVRAFATCVTDECDEKTNRISAAYLKAIADGEYFERIECVWRGLCGLEALDITRLTALGSSSGSEMLLGILCALYVCGYDCTGKEILK